MMMSNRAAKTAVAVIATVVALLQLLISATAYSDHPAEDLMKSQKLLHNLQQLSDHGDYRKQLMRVSLSVNTIIDEYLGTRVVVMFSDEVRHSELGQQLLADMTHPRLLVSTTDLQLANGLLVYIQHRKDSELPVGYDTMLGRLPSSDHSRHMILWDGIYGGISQSDRIDLHRIQVVFEAFWQYQLVDVAVLVPMSTGSIRVYTFNPYTASRCDKAGPPIMINIWSGWTKAFLRPDKVFGLNNKLKDLHKCPLKCLGIHRPPVSTVVQTKNGFHLSGSGLRIIDFMQRHMNFTAIVSIAYGHNPVNFASETFVSDRSDTTIGEKVKTRKVDLAFGRFTRVFDSESEVEFIKEDQMDCFTWGLPGGIGHDPTLWTNYVVEFSPFTWMLIIFSIFLASTVFVTLSQYTFQDPRPPWSPPLVMFYTYATFIGAPIKVTPRSCALQVFLSNWLLYSLVITSAYQAYLGSLITIPQTTPEINDQHTLLRTKLNLVGRQQIYYLINSSAGSSSDFGTLLDRYQILPPEGFGHTIRRILLKRDTAVLASKRELIFYAQRYKKVFNDSIHVLPECMIESYSSTFMLRKGSPFRHRISTIMSRLSETGIMQQWDRSNVKEELAHAIVFTKDTVLSMSQFYGAFVVWIFGLFLGSCMFIAEFIVFFIKAHNTRLSKQTKQLKFLN